MEKSAIDKNQLLWKVYFWLVATGLISYLIPGYIRIWEFIDLVCFLLALTALFGFCWNKIFLAPSFWRVIFVLTTVWNFFYAFFVPAPYVFGGQLTLRDKFISYVFCIPLLVANFLYAFKSKLWQSK